jgi:hypothetical protein
MSDITPIRPGVAIPVAPKPLRSRRSSARKILATTIDTDLTNQSMAIFRAMGIVRLASEAIQNSSYADAKTDAWMALEVAHELLSRIPERIESIQNMLADQVQS